MLLAEKEHQRVDVNPMRSMLPKRRPRDLNLPSLLTLEDERELDEMLRKLREGVGPKDEDEEDDEDEETYEQQSLDAVKTQRTGAGK